MCVGGSGRRVAAGTLSTAARDRGPLARLAAAPGARRAHPGADALELGDERLLVDTLELLEARHLVCKLDAAPEEGEHGQEPQRRRRVGQRQQLRADVAHACGGGGGGGA